MRLLPVLLLALAACGDADPAPENRPEAVPDRPDSPRDRPAAPADRPYVGVIAARESTDLSAKVAGEIAEVHVRIGDRVAAGDPIATVSNRSIREEIAVTQAAIRSARAAVAQAAVEVEAAKEALAIEEEAFRKGTSSKRDLTTARFRHRKALAALQQAKAAQAEQVAYVEQLRSRLKQSTITAPFAGTIAMRHLDPGATVEPGTPIVRVITSGELWVKFAVPGADAANLSVGDQVLVTIEGREATATATIEQIAPELEPNSQMIIVEAGLDVAGPLKDQFQSGLKVEVRGQDPPD